MKLIGIFLFGLFVFLFSCNSSSNEKRNNSENETYSLFFDFDELAHYRIEIDETVLIEKEGNENISTGEQMLIDLIITDAPKSLNDTSFVVELENIGFEKTLVKKGQFGKINQIFREKEIDETYASDCFAVYRDILIFKKNNKIVGLAKICFSCNHIVIHGTTANTINFGQDGDYDLLNKILNK